MQTLYVWELDYRTGEITKDVVTTYETLTQDFLPQKTYRYSSPHHPHLIYIDARHLDQFFRDRVASFTDDDKRALDLMNQGFVARIKKRANKTLEIYHRFLNQNNLDAKMEFSFKGQ